MRCIRIFRILGIAVIMALLIAAIPAAPALAFYDMTLTPAQGAIGDTITITGANFPATTDPLNPHIVSMYFSNQDTTIGQSIGTQVTVYKTISQEQIHTTVVVEVLVYVQLVLQVQEV